MNRLDKKAVMIIVFILMLFIIFLYFYQQPRNYNKNYKIGEYEIEENYNVENSAYIFNIKYKNTVFPFIVDNKYLNKRALIKNVIFDETSDNICILPKSDYLELGPLCIENNNLVSLNNVTNSIKYNYRKKINMNKEFNEIRINDLYNKTYLLYNYSGFYYISKNKNDNIQLFKKDNYDINIIYQYDKYLLIADYNEKYYIRSFYLINSDNGKVSKIKNNYEISYESRFLGEYKGKIYLLDEKNEKEYIININKKTIKDIPGKIFDGKELIDYKISTIINKKLKFYEPDLYNYIIIDKKLYQQIGKSKVLLTKDFVTKIIFVDKNTVYYISNNKLYLYNNLDGNVLLLDYFEWNFKNKNMIYIFNTI